VLVVRVMGTGALAGQPLAALIAAMEAAGDPRRVGRVARTEVSGLPAARATVRHTDAAGRSDFPILVQGYFVPRGTYMFLIEFTAPEESARTLDGLFAQVLASIQIED
jgi:hypothetical protein